MSKPAPTTNTKSRPGGLHYDAVMRFLVSEKTITEQEATNFWQTYACEYAFDGSENIEYNFAEDLQEMNDVVAGGETDSLREPHRKIFEAIVNLYGDQEYGWHTSW